MFDLSTNNPEKLQYAFDEDPRWATTKRSYSAEDVLKLRPSINPDYTMAKAASKRFGEQLVSQSYMNALGALTGSQAVQMVKAGLQAIYLSGWQVAADANQAGQSYPDQSLYPSNSVPMLVKRLNAALTRADLIAKGDGASDLNWYAPIIADAEAGFGGPLHAFELMKQMIEAGAAGVHFEDQLAAEKKCGHLGGKVLLPTSQFIKTLTGARLAADVAGVGTYLIARTDSHAATLMTSDIDQYDEPFLVGTRTSEGYFHVKPGLEAAVHRSLAYAPHADLLWFETSTPDIGEAKEFAQEIKSKYPNIKLAYNCSPSFHWKKNLNDAEIASFQETLCEYGYKFQFITLAGWHNVNYHMFDLADKYKTQGMKAYVELQNQRI